MDQSTQTEKSSERAVRNDNTTPMMRQYNEIKSRNPDTVLLYRMGDFYEMFNEDAKIASKVLGLTLTSRNHGEQTIPSGWFPFPCTRTLC